MNFEMSVSQKPGLGRKKNTRQIFFILFFFVWAPFYGNLEEQVFFFNVR